jgi:hypothetical protein
MKVDFCIFKGIFLSIETCLFQLFCFLSLLGIWSIFRNFFLKKFHFVFPLSLIKCRLVSEPLYMIIYLALLIENLLFMRYSIFFQILLGYFIFPILQAFRFVDSSHSLHLVVLIIMS